MRSERDANLTNVMRADHEFYCSNTAPINHKASDDKTTHMLLPLVTDVLCDVILWIPLQIHLRHEKSHSHVKSTVDVSYGQHWDEINNKRTFFLSQSFKNQSTLNYTSYTLEVNTTIHHKASGFRSFESVLPVIPVQSPVARGEFELQDSASALPPEAAGFWEQHSPQNQLQWPDATGSWNTLEKPLQALPAEEVGR